MEATDVVLAADVGKSRCRVELRRGTELLGAAHQHGFPGVHTDNGPTIAFELLLETVSMLPPGLPVSTLTGIGAAVAGVEASAEKSRELAIMLSQRFGVPAAVLSDATAAQLGALQGAPGTTLIVGTGAVAFRFDEAGILHRADGWGPYLGDRGSGRWIGQRGLGPFGGARRRPGHLAFGCGRALVDSPEKLPGWLASVENPYRAMARFAPLVLHAAEAGDAVANVIVDEACRILTHTVKLASSGDEASSRRVALLGGVVSSGFFAELLRKSLASAGIEVVAPLVMAWTVLLSLRRAAGSSRKGTSTVTEQTGQTDADRLAGLRTELAGLETEAAAENLSELDIMGTEELVAAMLAHTAGVHTAVEAASPAIVQTVDAVAERLQRGGRLLYVGAGTAGRLKSGRK